MHVDESWSGTETGLSGNPFNTVQEGLDRIGDHTTDAKLYVRPGSYSGAGNYPVTVDKAMTVYTWGTGVVEIKP